MIIPTPMVALANPQPVKRGRGRPTDYNTEVHEAIVEAVRAGLSPTRAAQKAGFNHAVITDWREKYPEFSTDIAQAEAEYVQDRIAALKACQTKWGTPDPKALEIELRRFSEFRIHQEVTSSTTNLNVSVQLTSDNIASVWQRHIEAHKVVSVQDISQAVLTDSGGAIVPQE